MYILLPCYYSGINMLLQCYYLVITVLLTCWQSVQSNVRYLKSDLETKTNPEYSTTTFTNTLFPVWQLYQTRFISSSY